MGTEDRGSRGRRKRGFWRAILPLILLAAALACAAALAGRGLFWPPEDRIDVGTGEDGAGDPAPKGREPAGETAGSVGAEAGPGETAAEEEAILPAYDMRRAGFRPDVPDQGDLGTCWAFASLLALESSMPPGERIPLSADHMSLKNSFDMSQAEGGDYMMAVSYLLAWQGPVAEADDPYGDGWSPDGVAPVCHVQGVRIREEKDPAWIKRAVKKYGGVQTSLYMPVDPEEMRASCYREETGAYFYSGTRETNHDVVVIGWDDAYPKENFKRQPERDGAFLCMNSWGTEFGDRGCFYVSYEDAGLGRYSVAYSDVEPVDNYDGIYQTDLCGWIGRMGYGGPGAWFANMYRAKADETLRAAGFYATTSDVAYRVYVARRILPAADPEETGAALSHRSLVAEGTLPEAGFYTVPFERPAALRAGERFAVIVEIDAPGEEEPVAVEYRTENRKADIDIRDGEGYISFDGSRWKRAEETKACNICLKAYTTAG